MNFIEGTLFKTKISLKAFTDEYYSHFIMIPPGSILTYILLKKRRRPGAPFVFIYENQIVRIKYGSFPPRLVSRDPSSENHYGFAFEEIKIESEII